MVDEIIYKIKKIMDKSHRNPLLEEHLAKQVQEKRFSEVFKGATEQILLENEELQEAHKAAVALYERRLNGLRSRGRRLEKENVKQAAIIEALLKINSELFKRAHFDALTGLHNRQGFIELLKAYAENGVRRGVLISLDIDKFKSINDTHNHITGNRVLRAVAEKFSKNFRASDPIARVERKKQDGTETPDTHTVGRLGGEEILIFLPEADLQKALTTLRKLKAGEEGQNSRDDNGEYISIRVPFEFEDQAKEDRRLSDFEIPEAKRNLITFSGSLGQITLPERVDDWGIFIDKMIEQGETALYQAKNSGRDKVYLMREGREDDGH